MAFLQKTSVFILILWILGHCKLALGLIDNCNLTQKDKRMSGTVVSTPNVLTSLQCLDYCFRESSCEGFNFKPRVKEEGYAECELVTLNGGSRLDAEQGWMYMKADKAELRKKWLGNDCESCGERATCNRRIDDICPGKRCECKRGYLDDGTGTCPLVSCSGSGLFTGNTGNISRPTKIEQECTATGSFKSATLFTCYYHIILDATKNVSIQFSNFEFKYSNAEDCSTGAFQYLEVYVDSGKSASLRLCGDHGIKRVERWVLAKKVTLKMYLTSHLDGCIKMTGKYTVN
eukprot:Seg823.7 transcript_id=Seg823.7/GoldUCD/mRNA.D3Y31 product="hypothetical protein" protein_id=Seg823.7/GoldUCD/D3Y31